MTSDAKIGLLLGLVFIFIIAFIINGLPKLRGQSDSNELTNNMVRNTPPGIGWGGSSDEVIEPQPEGSEETVEGQASSPVAGHGLSARQQQSSEHRQTVSQDPDLRHSQEMPVYSPLTGDSFSRDSFGQERRQTSFGPVRRTADEFVTTEAPGLTYKSMTPRPVESQNTDTIRPVEPPKTVTIRPPKPVKPKTYLVTSGDSLGSIAKKMYGALEGNKRANVARIFEANRKLLESPDEIKIGQELVIPPLPSRATIGGLLPGSMFKEVRSIGQRTTPGVSVPKPMIQTRIYTVKDGDSLWSISADLLGNGIRYKEIAKLNTDVLPNEDDVRVGTKLKIPAK
ncbi:MAG: LysM peptidoglycan-binding domain-containing protein [Planctomycetota bacterium]|jgi:nucleoid-associated protein YgaU